MLETFAKNLALNDRRLERKSARVLQVNTGLDCNQACRHCHLSAGPGRPEVMDAKTVEEVVAYQARAGFSCVDITGGAPERNPHLLRLLEGMAPLAPQMMFRANLTALVEENRTDLLDFFREHRVVVAASFPALSRSQTDAQRGAGVFEKSLAALKMLNEHGFGMPDSGLCLDLVSNPSGAFMAPSQEHAARRFRKELAEKHGVSFNQLFCFANVPLGRFREWLAKTGNLDAYLEKLSARFNPCSVDGLMCRTTVSVAWDGTLYDCDFNQAAGLPFSGRKVHVREMEGPPEPGSRIQMADHCYTCTAGAGFT